MSVAAEVSRLKDGMAKLSSEELERLGDLEEVLQGSERNALAGLTDAESDVVWETMQHTRDPMAIYWEYRVSKGLDPNLDITEVPPRDQWNDP